MNGSTYGESSSIKALHRATGSQPVTDKLGRDQEIAARGHCSQSPTLAPPADVPPTPESHTGCLPVATLATVRRKNRHWFDALGSGCPLLMVILDVRTKV